MCGIAGGVDWSGQPFDEGLLRRMAAAMRHRGPDDEGMARWPAPAAPRQGASAALISRRLSIIDVAGGRQPMANEDGSVWAAVNGEIYNHRALRRGLEAQGHRFATKSDAEAVVHLYEQRGEACIAALDGMFALAIWDERRQRMILARDRFGKKPLVYAQRGGRLLFASEFQALFQDETLSRSADPEALELYFSLMAIPAPWTIYAGVRKLPPAHVLIAERGATRVQPYWSLAYEPKAAMTDAEAAARLRELLDASVRKRLMSDVPLGVFLSGGVDSTAIVEAASRLSGARVKTFTIGFSESAFNELPHARRVARHFGTEHQEDIVDARSTGLLPLLATHFGEPFGDSSAIPTYYLSRMARRGVTVALSGEGGDELFAGYGRHQAARDAARWQRAGCLHAPLEAALGLGRRSPDRWRHGMRWRRWLWAAAADPAARYEAWVGVLSPGEVRDAAISAGGAGGRLLARQFASTASLDPVDAMLAADAGLYLPSDLLTKVDIASMANSLEVRAPFLDLDLAEFAARLPSRLKLRGTTGKFLLKRALVGRVPGQCLTRPKQGFAVPIGAWLRTSWRGMAEDLLLSSSAARAGLLRQQGITSLMNAHMSGRRDAAHAVWALLMVELWHRHWMRPALMPAESEAGVSAVSPC
jgi:asparagine synthase (glutamine-hydrolysing)